jgi:hypothetical protein
MSIYLALDLLLECARCEGLSPWSIPIVGVEGGRRRSRTTTTTSMGAGEAGSENEDENGMMGNASEDDVGLHDDVNDDEAARCRRALDDVGIDDVVRKWLARLVATRTIVAVPIADVAGLHADLVRYTCPAAGTSNAPISTGGATAATMAVLHRLAPPTRVQLWISRSHTAPSAIVLAANIMP